ncbi:TetR/AcrR family transcriptional regulator [uncultured Desulfosarcina sp.]|uniref:TetR/AcrR family transcriptional regulator n=1 Tax=uncultured Desulfosarcina sp. TaxID=218289 RepID=UPI0029C68B33|nr:TetR/AcrR family transcriptional regulator [uncultured Desulfosarcina sp.]
MSVTPPEESETRQRLVAAAVDLFHENGYQKTRVSDIVARTGVSQGTFYLYFRSKEAIFLHICEVFTQRLTRLFVTGTQGLFEGDNAVAIEGNLRRLVRKVFNLYREDLAVAELLFREGIGNGGIFKKIYEGLLTTFVTLIRRQLEIGCDKKLVSIEDPEAAAVFLFGMVERGLLYYLQVRESVDLDHLEDQVVAFILHGIGFNNRWQTP